MDLSLKDKVAVVTGDDFGIAKVTAKLLAGEGAKVTIIDKTSETLRLAAEELKKVWRNIYGSGRPHPA